MSLHPALKGLSEIFGQIIRWLDIPSVAISESIEASRKFELFNYLLDTLPIEIIKQAEMLAMTTPNTFFDLILAKDPKLTITKTDLKEIKL